jgi:putative ABC transport system permease protein
MRLFLLALRNLMRSKRRTLLTALAIFIGAAALVVLQGFAKSLLDVMVDIIVLSKSGAIQVHRRDHIGSDNPLKLTMPHDPALVARILSVPGITAVAPQIGFEGVISNGSEAAVLKALAIDPAVEYTVCTKRLTNLTLGSRALGAGQRHEREVLISKPLADSLGAKQGSTLVVQSAGPHAPLNALDLEVVGFLPIRHFSESKRQATVTLSFAQELLSMKGEVTAYIVGVSNLDEVDQIAARLRTALGSDYDVRSWYDLDTRTREATNNYRYALGFVAVVLFVLVAAGCINTMLMSVYERVREIGTMLAVGVRRWQVMLLFLWEAVALGLFGGLGGSAAGYLLVRWLGWRGVTLRPPGGELTIIRPNVGFGFLCAVVGFAVVSTVLAALYPARKAARLRPVDALRAT